jgi:DNA-binding NarL/FixJ family response regulator
MSVPLVTGVLLADDHPIVRHGLREILNAAADFRVVDEVEDGAAACSAPCRTTSSSRSST